MSDQDFFFDEDEQPKAADKPAKAEAKKSAPAKSGSSGKAAAAAPAAQTVTMTVAALIGVIALLAGLVIGILLPIGNAPTQTINTQVPSTAPGEAAAPQLSPEQMETGELPPGHPDLGAMGGATGSGEASGTAEEGKSE